jgi:hypothetical protein
MNPRKKPPERQPTTPIIPLLLGGIILLAVGAFGGYLIANSKTTNITTIPVIPTPSDAPDTTRPTSMPKPTTVAKEAELSSMTGWKKMPMDIFMISLPPEATMEEHEGCTDDVHTKFDTCFLIQNHDPNLLAPPHITIKMKTYQ